MDTTCVRYAFNHLDIEDVKELEHVSNQEGFNCKYLQLTPGTYYGRLTTAKLNQTLVFLEQHRQSTSIAGATPVDDYLIGVPLGNHGFCRAQGKKPDLSDVLLLKPGVTFDLVSECNINFGYIQLPQEQMRKLCTAVGADVGKLNQYIVRSDPNAVKRLQHVLHLATKPLSEPEPVLLQAQAIDAEQQLLEALADVLSSMDPDNTTSDHFMSPNAKRILALEARNHLETTLGEPIKMIDLCAELDCRLRTLHHAFAGYFGSPPATYHKKIRMNAARRTLLQADPEVTTVTNVAIQYGFWHLGRFALDYKQLFGESPSQSLAHVKPRFSYTSLR